MKPRILIVDDSAYIRVSLSRSLQAQGFDIVGQARNGAEAIEKNVQLQPDVVLMDLQMPIMDGVEATRRMLQTRRVPILVFASLDERGADLAIAALAEGAYDVIAKAPRPTDGAEIASHVWSIMARGAPAASAELRAPPPELIVVASSTGGPPCLEALITSLPAQMRAPMVVAQHMPAGFTRSLADRLNGLSRLRVYEAADGDTVAPGEVAILPGGTICTLAATGREGRFRVIVAPGDGIPGAKPSANALFFSALDAAGPRVLGIVLTGMGADGSDAVAALTAAGAFVIAQDTREAVIPSMPRAALLAGAQAELPLVEIKARLLELAEVEAV